MQGSAGKVKSRICKRSELKPVIAQVTATYTATGSEHVLSLSTSANLCSQHRSENPFDISFQFLPTNYVLRFFAQYVVMIKVSIHSCENHQIMKNPMRSKAKVKQKSHTMYVL